MVILFTFHCVVVGVSTTPASSGKKKTPKESNKSKYGQGEQKNGTHFF